MDADELDNQIHELEQRLDRLRSLYEQYFLGIEKIEPAVARKDVDRRFWVLRKVKIRNTARRFKLQTLIQRYNTFQQHWARICREIENGTYRRQLLRAERRMGPERRDTAADGLGRDLQRPDRAEAESRAAQAAQDLESLMDEDLDLAAEAKRALAAVLAPRAPAAQSSPPARAYTASEPPTLPRIPVARASAPLDKLELDDFDLSPQAPAERATSPAKPVPQGIAASKGADAKPVPPAPARVPSAPNPRPPAPAIGAPAPPHGAPAPRPSAAPVARVALKQVAAPALRGAVEEAPTRRSPEDPTRATSAQRTNPGAQPSPTAQRPGPAAPRQPQAGAPAAAPPRAGQPNPWQPIAPQRPPQAAKPPSPAQPPNAARPPSPDLAGARPAAARPAAQPAAAQPAAAQPAAAQPAAAQRAPAPRVPAAQPAPAPAARPPTRSAIGGSARASEIFGGPAPKPAPRGALSDDRVGQLHAQLIQAKRQLNDSGNVSVGGLKKQLEASAERLQAKHKGRQIDFDVVVKDGKAVVKPRIR